MIERNKTASFLNNRSAVAENNDLFICIKGNNNTRYMFYLKLLNEIDDSYVMYF